MAQVYGSISELALESDDVTEWVERLEQWFIANNITTGEQQRALLLSNIGARGYKLLRSLSQNQPTAKSYAELKKLLLDHINPKPNVIAVRFAFYRRDRRAGENFKDYIAELHRLSEYCEFGANFEEHLRDKFVCGLNDGVVQQKLLALKNLTLATAIETAIAMEAAAKSAKQIHGVGLEGQVHRLGNGNRDMRRGSKFKSGTKPMNSGSKKECYRCGSLKHLADNCNFIHKECFGCKKPGHSIKMCKNKNNGNRGQQDRVHFVEEEETPDVEEFEDDFGLGDGLHFLNLYKLGENGGKK